MGDSGVGVYVTRYKYVGSLWWYATRSACGHPGPYHWNIRTKFTFKNESLSRIEQRIYRYVRGHTESQRSEVLGEVCSQPDLPEKPFTHRYYPYLDASRWGQIVSWGPFTHRYKLASQRAVVRSMLFETVFRWCRTSWMRRPNYSSAIVLFDKCNTARRVLFLLLVRIFWMDGSAKSELALSRARCAGPDSYRQIGKFQAAGRI